MNKIHTPNKTSFIEPMKDEIAELKDMVDSMCQARSELWDDLDQLWTNSANAKKPDSPRSHKVNSVFQPKNSDRN